MMKVNWFVQTIVVLVSILPQFCGSLVCPHGPPTGPTLTTNGGFETGFDGWVVGGSGERYPGTVYHPAFTTGFAVELDVNQN